MNFFEILYAKKNGAALPANFFDLLFAKSFTPAIEWGEYDGTLPATYSANGDYLADYRIYGVAGGVADRTENLINPTDVTPLSYVNSNGNITSASNWKIFYVPVSAGETYTCSGLSAIASTAYIGYCNSQKTIIGIVGNALTTAAQAVTAPVNAVYLAISDRDGSDRPMCVLGSTDPAEYVPYGYEVDMSVSDGTTSTTIPIYIGDTPLGEDEYVDYGEQKVYRRKENLFDKNTIVGGYAISKNGKKSQNENFGYTPIIPVSPEQYSLTNLCAEQDMWTVRVHGYIGGVWQVQIKEFTVTSTTPMQIEFTVPQNIDGIRISLGIVNRQNLDILMLTLGSALTPTDPPVPLPALPTVDGTTITDYAGQSAAVPSRFYAKYQRK